MDEPASSRAMQARIDAQEETRAYKQLHERLLAQCLPVIEQLHESQDKHALLPAYQETLAAAEAAFYALRQEIGAEGEKLKQAVTYDVALLWVTCLIHVGKARAVEFDSDEPTQLKPLIRAWQELVSLDRKATASADIAMNRALVRMLGSAGPCK